MDEGYFPLPEMITWFGSVLNLPIMGFASGLGPGPRGLSSTSRSAQGQKIVTLNLTSKSSGHGLKSIPAMLKLFCTFRVVKD